MRMLAVAAVFSLLSPPALAQNVAGQASVIDGDTIEIHGMRIRLSGVDAPESSQLCRGDDSLQYQCGAKSANELSAFIGRKVVTCEPQSRDRYGRTVATCFVGGIDLAEWLVKNGLAFDWPRYSKGKYAGSQNVAEHGGKGMWGGSYVVPWLYRQCIRNGGRPGGCSDEAK